MYAGPISSTSATRRRGRGPAKPKAHSPSDFRMKYAKDNTRTAAQISGYVNAPPDVLSSSLLTLLLVSS